MSEQDGREPAKEARKSRSLPTILLICVLAGIAVFAIYYFAITRDEVKTNDAYVNGNLVRLSPQIGGTVIAIDADETQYVQRGQVLVQLDPRDTEVALAQAKASLGQTVRDVAQLFARKRGTPHWSMRSKPYSDRRRRIWSVTAWSSPCTACRMRR